LSSRKKNFAMRNERVPGETLFFKRVEVKTTVITRKTFSIRKVKGLAVQREVQGDTLE
jgi:hypothetical protein